MQPQTTIIRITCLFWLIAKAMSWPAWLAYRNFLVIPAFDFLEPTPAIIHTILFALSTGAITFLFAFPKIKWLPGILIISEIASCILDISRWQPWEYQYLFTIFILLYTRNKPGQFINAMVFIIATIYIYSGLQKFNGGFLYTIWDNMILRGFFKLSTATIFELKLHYAGLLLPIIETGAGLCLLFLKNKKLPAILLIAMHILLLVFLGPWGISYNPVVWPWNIVMIMLLYTLFINNSIRFRLPLLFQKWNIITFICWGLLPILSFFSLWPANFSSALYSGKTKNLAICIDSQEEAAQYTPWLKADKYNICTNKELLHVQKWSFTELNLPPYPEEWYYRKLARKWIALHPDTSARFYIYSYPYRQFEQIQ